MNMISDIRRVVRYWWIFLVLGPLLILTGLLIFNHPVTAYAGLSILFEIAFLINGLLEISFALGNYRSVRGWGWHLGGGIFDLLVGILLVSNPILSAISLPLFAGFWLLFRSIAIVGRLFDFPVGGAERAWMLALGLAGVVFSFMILYNPVLGIFTIVTWTALALITVGLSYIFLGLHLKRFHEHLS